LVDPSGQGPFTSVGIHRISDDASLLAYELKHGGGDATEFAWSMPAAGAFFPLALARITRAASLSHPAAMGSTVAMNRLQAAGNTSSNFIRFSAHPGIA